jgi:hypothetical protein
MKKKSTTNQLVPTPMRIPKIRASWIVPPRRINLCWHPPGPGAYAVSLPRIPSLTETALPQQAKDPPWLTK